MKTSNNLLNKSAMTALLFSAAMFASCSKELDVLPANVAPADIAVATDDNREARLSNVKLQNFTGDRELLTAFQDESKWNEAGGGLSGLTSNASDYKGGDVKLISKPDREVCRKCESENTVSSFGKAFAPVR